MLVPVQEGKDRAAKGHARYRKRGQGPLSDRAAQAVYRYKGKADARVVTDSPDITPQCPG